MLLPTLIKNKIKFSSYTYKEIQSGAVSKSYMRKGFIYEEMRKYFPIYEEAVSHIWLCNCSALNFLIYEENLIFFFISVLIGLILFCLFPHAIKISVTESLFNLTYSSNTLWGSTCKMKNQRGRDSGKCSIWFWNIAIDVCLTF